MPNWHLYRRSIRVEDLIFIVRGQKVMMDSDLAALFGVETGALNRQVKRNFERFPEDFMFRLTREEVQDLMARSASFKTRAGKRKFRPYMFTEYGIAALSGVLNSAVAISVNHSIIRTFIKMRKIVSEGKSILDKIESLEESCNKLFTIIFERIESLEEEAPLKKPKPGKKIGLMKLD